MHLAAATETGHIKSLMTVVTDQNKFQHDEYSQATNNNGQNEKTDLVATGIIFPRNS